MIAKKCIDQRKYQCILWRDETTNNIQILQLNTITYGLTSSSYLATKCIQHLAQVNISQYPIAAGKMLTDFYVDDFISGADSEIEAMNLISDVTNILNQAGFPLRKIYSNCLSISQAQLSDSTQLTFKDTESKTLGIVWLPHSDCFQYKIDLSFLNSTITKRTVLSEIAKLFDPMGLISPIIVIGKLIMQEIWKLKVSWDESLPMFIHSEYNRFVSSMSQVPLLNIKRFIFDISAVKLELHGFSDASTRAYGACIYVRCIYADRVEVHLLCSKSRVAPIKPITLPRLELLAAVLLSELYTKIASVMALNNCKSYFWSDSTITLHWLNSTANRYKVFVANRIAVI